MQNADNYARLNHYLINNTSTPSVLVPSHGVVNSTVCLLLIKTSLRDAYVHLHDSFRLFDCTWDSSEKRTSAVLWQSAERLWCNVPFQVRVAA